MDQKNQPHGESSTLLFLNLLLSWIQLLILTSTPTMILLNILNNFSQNRGRSDSHHRINSSGAPRRSGSSFNRRSRSRSRDRGMNRSRRADNSDNRGGRGQPPNKRMRAGSPKDRYLPYLEHGIQKTFLPGQKKNYSSDFQISHILMLKNC